MPWILKILHWNDAEGISTIRLYENLLSMEGGHVARHQPENASK